MLACAPPVGFVLSGGDCADDDPNIYPNAVDICDGYDNDCDGTFDEDGDFRTYYEDLDGDGYGNPDTALDLCIQPNGYISQGGDCDDSNPNINPLQSDECDGIDNNCDGFTDENTCAQVSGRIWIDNGNLMEDADEIGVNGVLLRLIQTGRSSNIIEVMSTEGGNYLISGIQDGDYTFEVDYSNLSFDYIFNANPNEFIVDEANQIARIDFMSVENGEIELPEIFFHIQSTLAGEVSLIDTGSPMANLQVTLFSYLPEIDTIQQVLTGVDGSYEFTGISPGTYFLEFESDTLYNFLLKDDVGSDTEVISSFDTANTTIGQSILISIESGQEVVNINAQLIESASSVLSLEEELQLKLIQNNADQGALTLQWNQLSNSEEWEYTVQTAVDQTIDFDSVMTCRECTTYENKLTQNATHYFKIIATHTLTNSIRQSNIVAVSMQASAYTSIKIYPNPAQDFIKILSTDQVTEIIVYDQSGRKLKEITNENGLNEESIDLSFLDNGIYTLHLISNLKKATTKLVISK